MNKVGNISGQGGMQSEYEMTNLGFRYGIVLQKACR